MRRIEWVSWIVVIGLGAIAYTLCVSTAAVTDDHDLSRRAAGGAAAGIGLLTARLLAIVALSDRRPDEVGLLSVDPVVADSSSGTPGDQTTRVA